ncbi:hypothetical protein QFC19_006658 [Naganishia cerealis]|uniref:Uncharacterized protein n=1 Tax=Naganishia cerealis TaxID=610337 RepID=A0ACC2VFI5_9TREE|nr:hypothetical protein QFC19_006658 [Naganishia cerealis]
MSKIINQSLDQRLGPNEEVFGVGHSLGGYVLSNYSLHGRHRANVRALAGVSPDGAKFSAVELEELRDLMHVGKSLIRTYKMAKRIWPGNRLKATAMTPFLQSFFHSPAIEYAYNSDMLQPSLTPAEMSHLPPICLLWGTREAVLPASNLEYFKTYLPADRTTFLSPQGMAHGSLPDGPRELVDPIIEYFTRINEKSSKLSPPGGTRPRALSLNCTTPSPSKRASCMATALTDKSPNAFRSSGTSEALNKKRAKRAANKEKNRQKAKEVAEVIASRVKAWENAVPMGIGTPEAVKCWRDSRLREADAFTVPTQDKGTSLLRRMMGHRAAQTIPARVFKLGEVSAVVEGLMETHGRWSINFLDASCDIFLTADKSAAISFKTQSTGTAHVAVAFGDPLCAPEDYSSALTQFEAYCDSRNMQFGLVGVGKEVRDYARSRKWITMQLGSEQMINTETNSILTGLERPACTRHISTKPPEVFIPTSNSKVPLTLISYNPVEPGQNTELEEKAQQFYDAWSKRKTHSAHSTTISDLFALRGVMTYLFMMNPTDDSITGLAALMRIGSKAYLLDPVLQAEHVPSSVSDFLRLAAMSEVKKIPGARMSFGLEPHRKPTEMSGVLWPGKQLARNRTKEVYDVLKFGGKHQIHSKFRPDPALERPLYIVLAQKSWHAMYILHIARAIFDATNVNSSAVHKAYKERRRARKTEATQRPTGSQLTPLLRASDQYSSRRGSHSCMSS